MEINMDLLLQRASELKQEYHKDGARADWSEIEDILLLEGFNVVCDENFRCRVKSYEKKNGILSTRQELQDKMFNNKLYELSLKETNLKIEKNKVQQTKNLINKLIRDVAKQDTVKDIILNNVKSAPECTYKLRDATAKGDKIGVIQLSDWHYGLKCDNFLNTYNVDVFRERIGEVVSQAISAGRFYGIKKLIVLLQGDFISSSIHEVLRVQNQENVIKQIITTSDVIATILLDFEEFFDVDVYLVTDNHSRVTADKKESIEEESYIKLTEWYLEARLANRKGINLIKDNLTVEIATFKIFNHNCCAIHGHNDPFNKAVSNMTLFTRDIYDFIFTSHMHHIQVEEENMTFLLSNGCLSGVDDLSNKLRKSSRPMQLFSVYSEDKIEAICPLIVK